MSVSVQKDPLTQPQSADRMFYATGIQLDAADFIDEQTYHRGRLARALTYLHGSGTAAGLKAIWQPSIEPSLGPPRVEGRDERIQVNPGIAIDRLGRLIEVPRTQCIRLDRWFDDQRTSGLLKDNAIFGGSNAPEVDGVSIPGAVADLFLRYVVCERGKTPALAAGPFDALDAVSPSRLRDGFELKLFLRTDSLPTPQRTAPITADQLPEAIFNAWQAPTPELSGTRLPRLAEHLSDQDPLFVFLARLVVPAQLTNGEVTRIDDQTVSVQNDIRPFAYSTRMLAALSGT